jgi:hypothetical protein
MTVPAFVVAAKGSSIHVCACNEYIHAPSVRLTWGRRAEMAGEFATRLFEGAFWPAEQQGYSQMKKKNKKNRAAALARRPAKTKEQKVVDVCLGVRCNKLHSCCLSACDDENVAARLN